MDIGGYLWNVQQSMDLVDARRVARAEAEAARREIERLSEDVRRQRVLSSALWMILRDRFGVTDKELSQAVGEIELQRQTAAAPERTVVRCSGCDRDVAVGPRAQCLYCGAKLNAASCP